MSGAKKMQVSTYITSPWAHHGSTSSVTVWGPSVVPPASTPRPGVWCEISFDLGPVNAMLHMTPDQMRAIAEAMLLSVGIADAMTAAAGAGHA